MDLHGTRWQLVNLVKCPHYNGQVVSFVRIERINEKESAAIVRTHDDKMLRVRFENLEARDRSTTMQALLRSRTMQSHGDLVQQALNMIGLKSK